MTLPTFLLVTLGLGVAFGLGRADPHALLAGRADRRVGRGACIPYLIVRRRAQQADVQVRGDAARGDRPAGPRHPRGPSALGGAQDGGRRDAGADRRASSGAPTRSTASACRSRTRCSPWPTGCSIVDVRILVTAILIQREVGGNLAEVLDNLANVIRARFTIRRQLRVYTAQGRFSGYVLAVLPDRGRRRDLHAQPAVHPAPVHRSDREADAARRRSSSRSSDSSGSARSWTSRSEAAVLARHPDLRRGLGRLRPPLRAGGRAAAQPPWSRSGSTSCSDAGRDTPVDPAAPSASGADRPAQGRAAGASARRFRSGARNKTQVRLRLIQAGYPERVRGADVSGVAGWLCRRAGASAR